MRSCIRGPSRDKAETRRHTGRDPTAGPGTQGPQSRREGEGRGLGWPGEADVWGGGLAAQKEAKGVRPSRRAQGTGVGGTEGRGRPAGT